MCLVHTVLSRALMDSTSQDTGPGSVQALTPVAPLQAPAGLPTIPGPTSVLPVPDGTSCFLLVCGAQAAEAWTPGLLLGALRLPHTARGGRKSRGAVGAVGAVGESAKSQSQRQDEVHHPSSCSRPALASAASGGCSTHLRCGGNLPRVRTRPEDRLWRRDLPFQLPPVAIQT